MGIKFLERWSPEYALHNAVEDMEKEGLDGLKKHLTKNALESVESLESLSSKTGVNLITSALTGEDATSTLLDKLSECDWDLKEFMKGSQTSKAIVEFDYQDKLVGTVELTMIKEGKIWKIDNLSKPRFSKVDL